MTEAYEVLVAASVSKEIRRLPPQAQQAVIAGVTWLRSEPRSGKPLWGELRGLWSLRRGDYRVLYRVDHAALRVQVARVGHRRDSYRKPAP